MNYPIVSRRSKTFFTTEVNYQQKYGENTNLSSAAAKFMKAYKDKEMMTELSTDPADSARDIQRFLQKLRLEDLKEYKPDEMVTAARERALQNKTSQNKTATQKLSLTQQTTSPPKKRKYTRKKAN